MSSRWIADPSRQLTSARLCRASILRHRRVPRVMAPPVAIESHRHREGRHLGRRCRQPLADPSHAATSASGNDIPDNTDSLVFPGFAYRPSATVRRLSNPAFCTPLYAKALHSSEDALHTRTATFRCPSDCGKAIEAGNGSLA